MRAERSSPRRPRFRDGRRATGRSSLRRCRERPRLPASTSLAMMSLRRFRQRWPNVPVSTWCRRQMPSRPIAARKPRAWSCTRRAARRPPGGAPAALVGGILLNQNLEFIDTINDLVYQSASLPEGSQGTATLFLDDVRISTNVRLFEGRRALGTRVSAAVRSAVMDEGRTWLDSAFVVNDWYISAYEPLVDSYGKRVGMLYV